MIDVCGTVSKALDRSRKAIWTCFLALWACTITVDRIAVFYPQSSTGTKAFCLSDRAAPEKSLPASNLAYSLPKNVHGRSSPYFPPQGILGG